MQPKRRPVATPLYSIQTRRQLTEHLHHEFLLTNGAGAFANSSIPGCNTRRYHGLLCAATQPPVGRIMALNRIAEMLIIDDTLHELAVNQFGQNFHPRGDQFLTLFELNEGIARWTYDLPNLTLTKELQLAWQQNTAAIRYTLTPTPGHSIQLRLQPFVSLRDFHSLLHETPDLFDVHPDIHSVAIVRDNLALHLSCKDAIFQHKEEWWRNHTYTLETERGLDDTEDLFAPGQFVLDITAPTTLTLFATLEKGDTATYLDWETLRSRRPNPLASFTTPRRAAPSRAITKLLYAAADFIVARKSPDGSPGTTILAGYPWFADWGRDTMIALPGLLLTTGRHDAARQVLTLFSQYVSEGMIPNKFDDYTNEPSYNTVDASLWFIHAVFQYLKVTKDQKTFDEILRPACSAILAGYRAGTRYHIKMDPADGLISQGDPNTQLTWMDARCGDTSFTPRQGKPVEINALWYHALILMGETTLASQVAQSFRDQFWISPFRGLADVVDGTRKDTSTRPNQIFAVSLENSPLTPDQQHAVVEVVRRELLTPVGLRSLARSDPKYHASYKGNQWSRDEAYHNGTVWTWPMGAFLEAHLRVHKNSESARRQAAAWLSPLIDSMDFAAQCIGQISEIYEPEPPFRPVGCYAQAWSVSELLRLAVRLEQFPTST